MTNINTIYTTVSGGQTYIAADTKYIGSVDSYNNCFTQFFAWVFRLSLTVNFDGKIRCVNKASYQNLVCDLTQRDRIENIGQYRMFRQIAETGKLPTGNVKMRDVISSSDRQTLFKKLAEAISRGDTSKALLMIGKGAKLDSFYYDRSDFYPSFDSDSDDLSSESSYCFTVFKAAPIMQAAKKANSRIVERLKEAGANTHIVGKQYTFKRKITDIQRNLDWTIEPALVSHHHHDYRGHHHVHHDLQYNPRLRERTTVFTEDSRTKEVNYKFDEHLNLDVF